MTETLDRWWTPAAKVPLALLLTPGTDAEKDLGQGFLALHRAGAEACELVAKTAVADEAVLVAALAETRAIVVPQALGVISKGVEGPSYAGLLVRDVLDDAEASALALYRTCLAKGIAAPTAAQRVGMVFGVPGRELGKYASLATNPASKDIAVADAADRVLFSYVAKLVEAEYVPAKELVSKAPGPQRAERSDYLDEHHVANGPDGKFVSEEEHGALVQARSPLRPGQVRSVGPRKVGRQVRQERSARQTREQVRERVQITPERSTIASQRSAVARQLSPIQQEKSRIQLSSTALGVQSAIERYKATITPEEPDPKPMGLGDLPDPLMERDDPNAHLHGYLDQSLGFVVPSSRWSALSASMADGDTPMERLILAGALEEFAGEPEKFHETTDDNGNVVVHEDHQMQVKQGAFIAHDEVAGQPPLWIKALPSGITRGMTKEAAAQVIASEIDDAIREYAVEHGATLPLMRERGYAQPVANYEDPEQIVLVYAPPPEGAAIGKRPTPNLTEVVIPESISRGHDQGHGKHTSYELDKNQGLMIDSRQVYFDTALGVFRTRVTMGEVDQAKINRARDRIERARDPRTRPPDGLHKAMTAREFAEHVEHGDIERGEDGKFVAQPVAVPGRVKPVSLKRTGRAVRQVRQERQGRQERQERQQASVQAPRSDVSRPQSQIDRGQSAVDRSRSDLVTRAAIARSQAQFAADPTPDNPPKATLPVLELTDDFVYAAVDADSMSMMAADDGYASPESATKPWAMGWRSHANLLEHHLVEDASDAEYTLRTEQLPDHSPEDIFEGASHLEGMRPLASQTIRSHKDLWKLEAAIHKEMDTSGGQKVLTAHFAQVGDHVHAEMVVELVVHDHATPSQHLVRWDPSEVGDRPIRLVPQGEYHMLGKRFVRNWLESSYASALEMGTSTEFLANPTVKVWHAEDQP